MTDFPLNDHHRKVLALRNHLGKFAVPLHQELVNPEQLRALLDLSSAGIVRCIASKVALPHLTKLPIVFDVYLLTEAGVALCREHSIEAAA